MEGVANGVRREFARRGNLVIAEAGRFSEEEDVAVDIGECGQCLLNGGRDFLRAISRHVVHGGGVRLSLPIPNVVQRQIPRNFEHPRPLSIPVVTWHARARDTEENLLRQISCRVGVSDDAREITRETLAVRGEKSGAVGAVSQVDVSLQVRTPIKGDRLTVAGGSCIRS